MSISIHPDKHQGSIASVRARGRIAMRHGLPMPYEFTFFSNSSVCYVTVPGRRARNNLFTVPGITNAMEVRCVSLNFVPHLVLHRRDNGMPHRIPLRPRNRDRTACCGCFRAIACLSAGEREANGARKCERAARLPGDRRALRTCRREHPRDPAGETSGTTRSANASRFAGARVGRKLRSDRR